MSALPAKMLVGMVNVNCPACGSILQVDVRLKAVTTVNGSYLHIEFQDENPDHSCVGRRT